MELAKGKELLGGLVDTQAACYGDRELLGQLASGALIAQSHRYAVHKEMVAELSYRERKWLRAAAIGPGTSKAVLTGRSAARMLGMWVVAATPEHVELTLPSGFSQPKAEWAEGTKFYRGKLERTEIFHYPELPGIEFTGPVRTAFDIAIRHGFAEGLVAFDWLLASRGATRAELKQAVALMRGKKGVAVLREVLRYAVHIWPDSTMRCALCDLEKPRSRVSENQHRIVDTGKPLTSPLTRARLSTPRAPAPPTPRG